MREIALQEKLERGSEMKVSMAVCWQDLDLVLLAGLDAMMAAADAAWIHNL